MRYLNLQNNKNTFCYQIADSIYQSDTYLEELSHLVQPISTSPIFQIGSQSRQKNLYDKKVLIGNSHYQLKVLVDNDNNYQVKTAKQDYTINKDSIISQYKSNDMIILLGPVLSINLALNNTFCVHASAFMLKDKVFIIMGKSGTGKSTIARTLNKQPNAIRLTDDITPLKIIDGKLKILPKFPQLKLTPEQQYTGKDINRQLVFIFAQKSQTKTKLQDIDTFTAIKKLVNHTIGTRLFNTNELQAHLEFCNDASLQAKSYQLNYQHSKDSLSELRETFNEIS